MPKLPVQSSKGGSDGAAAGFAAGESESETQAEVEMIAIKLTRDLAVAIATDGAARAGAAEAGGKVVGKSLIPEFPMLDAAEVKPATWSTGRVDKVILDNYFVWGIPDNAAARIGQAWYDAEGNVFLRIVDNQLAEVAPRVQIGKVSVEGLPGKYGESAFGTAIEERVNQLIGQKTGQPHIVKHGNANGADFSPQNPPQDFRGAPMNDNATPP